MTGCRKNYAQLELADRPLSLRAGVSADRHHDPGGAPRLLCMLFFLGSAWFLYRLMGDLRPVACTGWAGDLPFFAPVDDDRP